MLLSEPGHTQYDYQFSVLGFPVRIHPMFWLVAVITGSSLDLGVPLFLWVVTFFVSILIHELGHALAMRRYGEYARVVLYGMGGLAISDGGRRGRGWREQVVISAAGPAAGFVFMGIVVLGVYAVGGRFALFSRFPWFALVDLGPYSENVHLSLWISMVLQINLLWGAINLLPVMPLDGGQIFRAIMTRRDPWNGIRISLQVSAIVAVLAAIFLFSIHSVFGGLLFIMLAYESFQAMQQFTGGGPRW